MIEILILTIVIELFLLAICEVYSVITLRKTIKELKEDILIMDAKILRLKQ